MLCYPIILTPLSLSSVVNVLILLLSAFVLHDRNSDGDKEEDGDISKNSHYYVLRVPSHISLFCAVVGSGMQLLTT